LFLKNAVSTFVVKRKKKLANAMSTKFGKLTALNDDAIVLELLARAAKEVSPLMERRNWYVDHLMEFGPNDKNLYGLNIKTDNSITIKIRCRHHITRKIFSYDSIMKTLLHELAHIQCGLHDEKFYTLLNQLTLENTGHVLDKGLEGSHGCSLSRTELRDRMARAAEKRTLYAAPTKLGSVTDGVSNGVIHSPGNTFSGRNMKGHLSAREAAGMAAIIRASLSDK
jgi:hypothetical protein